MRSEGIADELILGFRTEDDNSAPQSHLRNECVLITEDAKAYRVSKVNSKDPAR